MKRHSRIIGCLLWTLLVGVGCGKSGGASDSAATTAPQATPASKDSAAPAPVQPATAAATPAASATAAPPPGTPASTGAPSTPPASAAAPAANASPAAPAAESPADARKRAEIEWALKEDQIKNDPNGQWATQATASSAYNDAKGNAPYSPGQATGVPNIELYGNSGSAWLPKTPDAGIEWLELRYAKPVHATMVRVRESYGPGTVIKIELFDETGAPHVVWTGADSTKDLNYLMAEFPKTAFKTGRVKVTLATNVVHGPNEIDAVQLVGTDQ